MSNSDTDNTECTHEVIRKHKKQEQEGVYNISYHCSACNKRFYSADEYNLLYRKYRFVTMQQQMKKTARHGRDDS